MRVIRVRKENAMAALAAIPGAEVTEAPVWIDIIDEEWASPEFMDQSGFVGLRLPDGWSGTRAHKALVAAGIVRGRRSR